MILDVTFEENENSFDTDFAEQQNDFDCDFGEVVTVKGDGGGCNFTTDETLSFVDGVLSVNTAQEPEPNNTLPITAAAVATTVGNIEILLQKI